MDFRWFPGRGAAVALPVVALAACAAQTGPSGFWLLVMEGASVPAECETTVEENFTEAQPDDGQGDDDSAEPDGTWEYEDESSSTGASFYVEIVSLDDGQWALNYPGGMALGQSEEDGTLAFEWEESSFDDESRTHSSGYSFHNVAQEDWSLRVKIVPGHDGSAEVVWETVSNRERTWTETDEWDPDATSDSYSDMPADDYLETWDGSTARNDWEDDDCGGGDCTLAVTTRCESEATYTGTRATEDVSDGFLISQSYGFDVD